MKLKRLNGIANDVLRPFMLTPSYGPNPLFEFGEITQDYSVNLLTGIMTPSRDGDDVEAYYQKMSQWFRSVLIKEGIPISIIQKATIGIVNGKQSCTIVAGGKTFKNATPKKVRQKKSGNESEKPKIIRLKI